jgi:hypothetical protein
MPCTSPVQQWRAPAHEWQFQEPPGHLKHLYEWRALPCGKCTPCRKSVAGGWQVRLEAEAREHADSIIATLTYSDEHKPPHGSLCRRDLQLFFKRLRKRLSKDGISIKVDYIGEYSPELMRPHYHACIFGWRPADGTLYGRSSKAQAPEFISPELLSIWGKGRVTYQPFSDGYAGYVASHHANKASGGRVAERLIVRDWEGNEIARLEPEFHGCSLREGIGRRMFDKYGQQLTRQGFAIIGGRKAPLPVYYRNLGRVRFPEEAAAAAADRATVAARQREDMSDQRLGVIEEVAQASTKRRQRGGIDQ